MTLEQALAEKDSIIIDVRTYEEFEGGNVAGSINIPVSDLPNKLDDIKQYTLDLSQYERPEDLTNLDIYRIFLRTIIPTGCPWSVA